MNNQQQTFLIVCVCTRARARRFPAPSPRRGSPARLCRLAAADRAQRGRRCGLRDVRLMPSRKAPPGDPGRPAGRRRAVGPRAACAHAIAPGRHPAAPGALASGRHDFGRGLCALAPLNPARVHAVPNECSHRTIGWFGPTASAAIRCAESRLRVVCRGVSLSEAAEG